MTDVYKTLAEVQAKTKAPKAQYNSFGNYTYRSAEAIMEAVKPALKAAGAVIYLSDDITVQNDRIYVKSTATFSISDGSSISVSAFAREPATKKGMDESQITGAASSYARKYALSGLLLLDDNKDVDSGKPVEQPKPLPEDETARKAAGENYLGLCKKYNLVASYVSRDLGLKGKPSADDFKEATERLESIIKSGKIPSDWGRK